MNMRQLLTTGASAAVLFGWTLARPAPVAAHCDSMDGPVVTAARAALAQGRVELVLGWVRPQDETQIRTAFARALEVRRAGGEAQALADLWFFETLVGIHREGEGEPYTGLKPAGQVPAPGIEAADQALKAGTVERLAPEIAAHVADAVRERFERVRALADHDPRDADAARAYVHAYVEYIHFVERIVEAVHAEGHTKGGTHDDADPTAAGRAPDRHGA